MSMQGISLQVERPNLSADPANQMIAFRQYLNVLGDSQAKDENKLKAAQELNDNMCPAITKALRKYNEINGHLPARIIMYRFVTSFY